MNLKRDFTENAALNKRAYIGFRNGEVTENMKKNTHNLLLIILLSCNFAAILAL